MIRYVTKEDIGKVRSMMEQVKEADYPCQRMVLKVEQIKG